MVNIKQILNILVKNNRIYYTKNNNLKGYKNMKLDLRNIILENDKIIVENEEYDHNGRLIETPSEKYEKYEKPLLPGTIIDYDSEYVLILENNGYICIDYSDKISYLDYDWASDPRVQKIYSPFSCEKAMYEWIIQNEHHKDALKKYYKKSFFKKTYNY